MPRKRASKDVEKGGGRAARVRWLFPRATLEKALQIPYAVKNLNGGNPWEPEEISAVNPWTETRS